VMTGALELRSAGDGTVQLHGLASRFGHPYRIGSEHSPHSFIERVRPGAFSSSLSKPGFDCILTVEHARRDTLARTPATLVLSESQTGLEFDATLDMSDPTAAQAAGRIERGTLRECSFAFEVPPGGDLWNADRSERTITNASIDRGDVSLTVYGASAATGAQVVRGSYEERRAFTEAVSVVGVGGIGWERRLSFAPDVGLSLRRDSLEKYTAEQVVALGKKGQALRNPDGSYSWPIVDREDLQNAIKAVGGRAQKTAPEKVRVFIMNRAKSLGLASLIPANWRVDGSIKRSFDEFQAVVGEFEALRSGDLEVADQYLVLREANRHATKGRDDRGVDAGRPRP
jgi:HK97 family phage prohead protease